MKSRLQIVAAAALLSLGAACTKTEPAAPAAPPAAGGHEHHAPHGGTAVVLGHEAYHLELVRDAAVGKLTAYVLDGEMENFVRAKAPSFEIVARLGAESRRLTFQAVANPATGETVGDTSQFEASAAWLKTTASFDAVLGALELRGTKFEHVAFNFPRGSDKD